MPSIQLIIRKPTPLETDPSSEKVMERSYELELAQQKAVALVGWVTVAEEAPIGVGGISEVAGLGKRARLEQLPVTFLTPEVPPVELEEKH